jgi:MFS family permease
MTADIRLGLRHVWHSSYLRSVLLLLIPVDFAVHGALFALVVNLRQQGHSPETIGVAQAVIAVGGLSGALCSKWMQRRVSFQTLLICATGVGFALMIAATALTGRLAVIVPLTGAIFMVPAANAAIFGRLALVTPEHLQGRVVSVFAFAAGGASAWAPLTIGLLLDWASAPAAMLACAIAVGLSVVAAFSTKVDSDPVLTAG